MIDTLLHNILALLDKSETLHHLLWNRRTKSRITSMMRNTHVKSGRVMVVCRNGMAYNDSPRAIVDYIQSHYSHEFEVFVALEEPERFDIPSAVRKVKIWSLQFLYLQATAQFFISNLYADFMSAKSKGQFYIQTWHGAAGIKKIGFDAEAKGKDNFLNSLLTDDARRMDVWLSGSRSQTTIFRQSMGLSERYLECGLPRNDCFFDDASMSAARRSVYDYAGLTDEVHTVMYAPTFRDSDVVDAIGFDVQKVLNAFRQRFGGSWKVLLCGHPLLRAKFSREQIRGMMDPDVIDVFLYPEIQDVCMASDALITDYSSIEMDFLLTNRPQFQLIPDIEGNERGFYFHPKELPFPLATDDEALAEVVLNFDDAQYQKDLISFKKECLGLKENGTACKSVLEWMLSKKNKS